MSTKKTYLLGGTCPHCQGNGRLISTADHYRIRFNYQDGHEWSKRTDLKTLHDVKRYLGLIFKDGVMIDVFAPDGELINHEKDSVSNVNSYVSPKPEVYQCQ